VTGPCATRRVLIGGVDGDVHVGRHLAMAARELAIHAELVDTSAAFSGPRMLRTLSWRLLGHRPPRLRAFSRELVGRAETFRPSIVITTGLAPVDSGALRAIRQLDVKSACFLTDDPWSRSLCAPWFMKTLPEYDWIFSPRRANLEDLRRAGCRQVSYLPFGYAPDVHFPEPPASREERERFAADVVFVGGADDDRVKWIGPLVKQGLRVALWGGYWDRYPETRSSARGFADAQTVRKAINGATTSLCLVRQSNRDGHSMRSIEVPAIGACMIVEDTAEHRELFGEDTVVYVNSPNEACTAISELVRSPERVKQLGQAVHERIIGGRHTWCHRLESMMEALESW
jgi:spore maturation protein CgeB